MAADTDYKTALEITHLLCGTANSINQWQKVIDKLKKTLSASCVELTFVCTRNKKKVLDLKSGTSSIPLLHWLGVNETAIKDAVQLKETRECFSTVNLSFGLTDRDWDAGYPQPREACGPEGVRHAFACAAVYPVYNIICVLGILKDEKSKGFSKKEMKLLGLLQSALHQSFQKAAADFVNAAKLQSMRGMIDRAALGQFVVDSSGYILVANGKAGKFLEEQELFEGSARGYLIAREKETQEALKSRIRTSAGIGDRVPPQYRLAEQYLRVRMTDNRKGYLLIVSPVEVSISFTGEHVIPEENFVLIQVIDLSDSGSMDPKVLQKVLDITVTEATVLKMLSEGQSLREIARIQKRSYHTIRNHVQKVMNKTGMHRQADLLMLVHSVVLAGAGRNEVEKMRKLSG